MTIVRAELTMSLDGYVAGPEPSLEAPLGRRGEELHEWVVGLASWRARHGLEGGEENADSELLEATASRGGAVVMGRRMFSGGSGPWEDDPNASAWWGDDPPFGVPLFVVTHHARASETKRDGTTYTFVTDGVAAAIEQARAAAAARDVHVVGGASVIQQALAAGLVDELLLHVAPVLLGGGVRLFDGPPVEATLVPAGDVPASPTVTHLRYRVER
jgi:dihydrofolate reductase